MSDFGIILVLCTLLALAVVPWLEFIKWLFNILF